MISWQESPGYEIGLLVGDTMSKYIIMNFSVENLEV